MWQSVLYLVVQMDLTEEDGGDGGAGRNSLSETMVLHPTSTMNILCQ
jgi:hypothetical protein